ncbi:hypothetical protein DB795_20995, partial [Xanthomonas perforans]
MPGRNDVCAVAKGRHAQQIHSPVPPLSPRVHRPQSSCQPTTPLPPPMPLSTACCTGSTAMA